MARGKKSLAEKGEASLRKAKTLIEALNAIPDPLLVHGYFQHYTTLENLIDKIENGRWWLSCCTSDRLNDLAECVKYGSRATAARMYETCFSHGAAESVSMWGLYQCCKPCAVRITLTAETLRKWLVSLQGQEGGVFDKVFFRDVVYLATSEHDEYDKYDIRRNDCASWEGSWTRQLEDLHEGIREDWATALVKDYEWRHERETRLVVRLKKHQKNGLKVSVPNDVLEDMRFTFSPWLKPQMFDVAKKLISEALAKRLKHDPDPKIQRFRRSSVTGGLNLGDGRVPCAKCNSCVLFGCNSCWA